MNSQPRQPLFTCLPEAGDKLRRVRRSLALEIGDFVGEMVIGGVPDTGNDRCLRTHYRAHDRLTVERKKVFVRASAAREDDHVGIEGRRPAERLCDLDSAPWP